MKKLGTIQKYMIQMRKTKSQAINKGEKMNERELRNKSRHMTVLMMNGKNG